MDEIGELRMERVYDHDLGRYALRITRADPRVRILSDIIGHRDDRSDRSDGKPAPANAFLVRDGDVLTIRDDYGQRFIYRIRWDDYTDGGYLAEWPD